MSRTRYKIIENKQPYFVTCTTVNWIPIFANPEIVQIILNSLDHLQQHNRLFIYAYVIMENHIHLIAYADDLAKELGDFKSFTARKIIDYLEEKNIRIIKRLEEFKLFHKKDRRHQLWQEGNHPQLIQDEEMMCQKVEYIHNNPVRKGYVDEPVHWRYSSARDYAGQVGLLKICTVWE